MDFNVVVLEISDLIAHFYYYDNLVSGLLSKSADAPEEQNKIRNKSDEHLARFFAGVEFFASGKQLRPLSETKEAITTRLQDMKTKDIHDLIEKLEKDAKKIKKLYLSLTKKQ